MNYMTTFFGRRVNLPYPLAGQIHIDDVAHHLGRIPRFCGATQRIWPVAAHSLHVAALARQAGADHGVVLAALLHDAHEFLFSDVPSPIKAAIRDMSHDMGLRISPLKVVEDKLQRHVLEQLGAWEYFAAYRDEIKHWDLVSLATERRDLMHPAASESAWPVLQGVEPDTTLPSLKQLHPDHASYWWAMEFKQMYLNTRAQMALTA